MFSIFKKKEFLADLLPGLIDIHNHLLPAIDDGAASVEDSLKMISALKDLGITDFIATPHIMNDFYPNTPATIEGAMQKLKKEIKENSDLENVRLNYAAEYMMDQNFLEIMSDESLLTLKKNLVLVEMSYFQAPFNLNEILFQIQTQGYIPVLAHPERYLYYHSKDLKKFENLKNRGCYFQLNILSLSGHYGKKIFSMAKSLLENGMIDFLGSDIHRLQHISIIKDVKVSQLHSQLLKDIIKKTKDHFDH